MDDFILKAKAWHDQQVRGNSPSLAAGQMLNAIGVCWSMMPEDRRSVDHVCQVATELFQRALQQFREDAKLFT